MRNSQFSIPLVYNAVEIMTPFLLAAIGGLFTELSGMLNIALEGLILAGAFFSVIFAAATGSLFLGILLGILCAMLLSLLFGVVTIYLRANVFITGLATNLFASGFTIVLAFQMFRTKGVIQFPNIPKLPILHVPEFPSADPLRRRPAVRAQHHRVRRLAHPCNRIRRDLQDPFWHAPAGYGHKRVDDHLSRLESEALSTFRHTHLRIYLRACRIDAHHSACGVRSRGIRGTRLDSSRGYLSREQDSCGNIRCIVHIRTRPEFFQLRTGRDQSAGRFHPRFSLFDHRCRHDRLLNLASIQDP